MLDQLRKFVATAQAIQADVDAILLLPKRSRRWRSYTFSKTAGGSLIVEKVDANGRARTEYVPPRFYDIFVRLANSGNYVVEIMDSDYGVAWTLRRKAT